MQFRRFEISDEIYLAKIISDTWGYNRLSKNPQVAILMGKIYLYSCLSSQNFNSVAVYGSQPVGVIMGNIKDNPEHSGSVFENKLRQYYNEMSQYSEGNLILDMFAGFDKVDNEMLTQIGKSYDAELVFFVTGASVRGEHIGTTLYQSFLRECSKYNCKRIYVYTDGSCNFGFYEHQGFIRVNKKLHRIYNNQLEFYVYEKEITE